MISLSSDPFYRDDSYQPSPAEETKEAVDFLCQPEVMDRLIPLFIQVMKTTPAEILAHELKGRRVIDLNE